ncbi:hypothetical protein C7M84_013258 [Penaeus vannamei]|uniref:Uncharacterized protein n=1 Tax=Penaeus vannamei TaxID=6689 RepID=A0A423SWK6_PENVA|nr:hypothetical protein C7M84_013258 [Penaeus vannamei]
MGGHELISLPSLSLPPSPSHLFFSFLPHLPSISFTPSLSLPSRFLLPSSSPFHLFHSLPLLPSLFLPPSTLFSSPLPLPPFHSLFLPPHPLLFLPSPLFSSLPSTLFSSFPSPSPPLPSLLPLPPTFLPPIPLPLPSLSPSYQLTESSPHPLPLLPSSLFSSLPSLLPLPPIFLSPIPLPLPSIFCPPILLPLPPLSLPSFCPHPSSSPPPFLLPSFCPPSLFLSPSLPFSHLFVPHPSSSPLPLSLLPTHRVLTPHGHINDLPGSAADHPHVGVAGGSVPNELDAFPRARVGDLGEGEAGVVPPVLDGRLDLRLVHQGCGGKEERGSFGVPRRNVWKTVDIGPVSPEVRGGLSAEDVSQLLSRQHHVIELLKKVDKVEYQPLRSIRKVGHHLGRLERLDTT